MAFVAKMLLRSYVAVRGFFVASITNGLRTSWRSGRSRLLMTQVGQKLADKLKELRREGKDLKEVVVEQKHEFLLLKKRIYESVHDHK
jgi:hypothetical protein